MKLTMEDIKKINEFFAENKFYETADATFDPNLNSDVVIVSINWGDWKHEHLRANYLMGLLGYTCYYEDETETNGTDAYSADHFYAPTSMNPKRIAPWG